jgi:hypothetical protein
MLVLLVATVTDVPWAHADLYTANSALKKGDYTSAFKDFLALAKLGQPQAQLEVAYLYHTGQGVGWSDINAYAWSMLAVDNGEAPGLLLARQLLPHLAPGSTKIAGWITAPYTPAALERTLLPEKQPGDKGHQEERTGARPCRHPVMVDYPTIVREEMVGVQGGLVVEFSVLPDGTTRLPRIVFEASAGQSDFDTLARASVLRSKYASRSAAAGPIQCSIFYLFAEHTSSNEFPGLKRYVHGVQLRAQGGDPMSELVYGNLHVGLPVGYGPTDPGLPWLVKAAQAGIPLAQFETGISLIYGWGNDQNVAKGFRWLQLAAAQNEPNAEAVLAMQLLRDQPGIEATREAVHSLDQAAAQGDRFAAQCLSAVLAASPQPTVRDPQRASLLETKAFSDDLGVDPTGLEIQAAAQAAEGQFAPAVKNEQKAIARARHLGWNLSPLELRLTLYRSAQPWHGNLLDYESEPPTQVGNASHKAPG